MRIDEAEENDLQEILQLQYAAYQSEAVLLGTMDIPPLQQTLAELEDEYRQGIILKAVTDEEQIIGSVRAHEREGSLLIGKLIVHPDYQRRGIGSRLLREIEERYVYERCELFTSSMSVNNIRLYERAGYRRFAEKRVSDKLSFVFLEKLD